MKSIKLQWLLKKHHIKKKYPNQKKHPKSRPFLDLFMVSGLANSRENPSESRAIRIYEETAEEGLKSHQEKCNQKYILHAIFT